MTEAVRPIATACLPADEIRALIKSGDMAVLIAVCHNPLTRLSLAWPEVWTEIRAQGRRSAMAEAAAGRQSLDEREQFYMLHQSQGTRSALARNTSLNPKVALHLARGNRTPSTSEGDTAEGHDQIRRYVASNPRLPLALADELAAHSDYFTRRAIWENLLIRGVGDDDGTPRGALYEEFGGAHEPGRYRCADDGLAR